MAKNDNLQDFLIDVADAIREKKGTTEKINPQDFAVEIANLSSGGSSSSGGVSINNQDKVVDITKNGTTEVVADSGFTGLGKVTIRADISSGDNGWTGHADAEGLRAIGWTEEDIAYYQENGVNWNEEDDQYHKVPEENIALYGVLTTSNINTHKSKIIYLPKIDTSNVTSMLSMCSGCNYLVAVPQLNTSRVTNMSNMFSSCNALVSIPQLDTSSVTNMSNMFGNCSSLRSIPQLNTSNVTTMNGMFYFCYSLVSIPQLDTSRVTDMRSMFYFCGSLASVPQLDTSNVTTMNDIFHNCISLQTANIEGLKLALTINKTSFLTKDSLLYIINNEATTSAITIKLGLHCYNKYAEDADIVAALANHPNISFAV